MTVKIRVLIEGEWDVSPAELADYDAMTIEQAAANQQKWYIKSDITPEELLSYCDGISVRMVGVED